MKNDYKIIDEQLGTIAVVRGKRNKGIAFRMKNGALVATIPAWYPFDSRLFATIIETHRQRLQAMVEKNVKLTTSTQLYDGKLFSILETEILVKNDASVKENKIAIHYTPNLITYSVNTTHNLSLPEVGVRVSRHIVRHLGSIYGHKLIQLANECAAEYNLVIKEVRLGRGKRILGHCSSNGIITLSSCLLLYPQHLRRYVIYHELAHLTHHNHSDHFHQLCNHYCHGNEAIWRKELNKTVLPLCL